MTQLAVSRRLLATLPHLPAFWPQAELLTFRRHPPERMPVLLPADGASRVADRRCLRFSPGLWDPPCFGQRAVPPALVAAEADDPLAAELGRALSGPPPSSESVRRAAALRDLLREARVGGPASLPDPGPEALGHGHREAVLVLDPCRPERAAEARRMWARACAGAGRRPVLVLRTPEAPATARPVLAGAVGAEIGPALAPWTLLDAAAELHLLDGSMALLGLVAGVPVHCHAPSAVSGWGATLDAPGIPRRDAVRDANAILAALIAVTRCADPFHRRPWAIEDAVRLLADWRTVETGNRRIAVCTGMAFWKRRRIVAAFASSGRVPRFRGDARTAVAEAARCGGAVAVWSSRAPPGLERAAAASGVPLLWVEDGFIRSAGLGAGFLPGASLTVDAGGPYYDPAIATDLEALLATAEFPPALLARAEALRAALLARGITKYNLGGGVPDLSAPPGRRRVLVPGQVEDDLSILRGATGAVRGNLDLLRATRTTAPDAFIVFKPHPDVEAGYRRGGVPESEALRYADRVVARAPMAALLDRVDEVHTMTSLTGFEALLRGRRVTVWGRPFYAGWGLTEDRDPPPRRGRRLTVQELVAGTLILYPRYIDPVTELPCSPEVLLDRLSDPSVWRSGPLARLRRLQGQAMAALDRWKAR